MLLPHLGSTGFHTLVVKDGSQWVSTFPGPLLGGQSREATCMGLGSRRGAGGPRKSALCWLCSARLPPGSPILVHVCVLGCLSRVRLFATPWTAALHIPLSMGFCRQEYWSGWPRPSPGDCHNPAIEAGSLASPALAGGFLTAESPGKSLSSTLVSTSQSHFLHPAAHHTSLGEGKGDPGWDGRSQQRSLCSSSMAMIKDPHQTLSPMVNLPGSQLIFNMVRKTNERQIVKYLIML